MQGQEGGQGTGPQLLASVVPRSNAASATANMGLPSTVGSSHAAYPHQLPHAQGETGFSSPSLPLSLPAFVFGLVGRQSWHGGQQKAGLKVSPPLKAHKKSSSVQCWVFIRCIGFRVLGFRLEGTDCTDVTSSAFPAVTSSGYVRLTSLTGCA